MGHDTTQCLKPFRLIVVRCQTPFLLLLVGVVIDSIHVQDVPNHHNRLAICTLTNRSNVNHHVDTVGHRWINHPTGIRLPMVMTSICLVSAMFLSTFCQGKTTIVLQCEVFMRPAICILARENIWRHHGAILVVTLRRPPHQSVTPSLLNPLRGNSPCRYLVVLKDYLRQDLPMKSLTYPFLPKVYDAEPFESVSLFSLCQLMSSGISVLTKPTSSWWCSLQQ